MTAAICIAEDRASEADAVRLLVLSLQKYAPADAPILLHLPWADAAFSAWLAETAPNARLVQGSFPQPFSWDVKPLALLDALDRGHDPVVWIDSDVLLCGPMDLLAPGPELVVGEEPRFLSAPAGAGRTRLWGWAVGRELPHIVNSGVVRVTGAHRSVLTAWADTLAGPVYRAYQAMPFNARPPHGRGDQDVLTALLNAQRFADVPVRFLRSGREIVQSVAPSSWPLQARAGHLFGRRPTFIHAMRRKPWRFTATPSWNEPARWYDALHCELSPYPDAARRIARDGGLDLPWLKRRSLAGGVFTAMGFGQPALASLPLHAVDVLGRSVRRARSR